jgi:pimeloyl-ACP methyl ester carboxylesterase
MKRTALGTCALFLCAAQAHAQTMTAPTPTQTVSSTMASMTASMTASGTTVDNTAIRPFKVKIPQAQLVDLKRRIKATRWPDKETVADESQGVPLATLQELARYWATDYDWRKVEAKLNSYPQFVTNIDGVDIHFIQVKSKEKNALPIIITHGWPGSVIEQLKVIDPLTNPTKYGGSASDAFDVVIPSIPGYGFSDKPTTTGWDPARVARAWVVLMKRLGYNRFVAQGGDVGAIITTRMGEQAAPELVAIHTNFPAVLPTDVAMALGGAPPADLSADERRMFVQLQTFRIKNGAYAAMMTTRPQTLYGLTDSPVALAAWILDHGDGYDQPAAAITSAVVGRTINDHPAGAVTRDDVLDDITLYWLTNTGISAARIYWESKGAGLNAANVSIPAAVTVFPGEIYLAPRSWTERAYHKLIYYNTVDKGGHFAAWEQPELFASELRAAFKQLR